MKVLISGAGIAGTTLAYWLWQQGIEPTLLERASEPRTGGFIIDFWGLGYDVAERMGLEPELKEKGYLPKEVRFVGGTGEKEGGFPVAAFARIARNRYTSIPRGDLAAAIYGKIEGRIESIFGDQLSRIEQSESAVRVEFEKGKPREFDLVIGADGLHSRVRQLVFGDQRQFEKYLGYKVAAFEATNYRPRDEDSYLMYSRPGIQVGRFTMRGDRTLFLFMYADENPELGAAGLSAHKSLLRQKFQGAGWECDRILDAMERAEDLYFDRVSQIRMAQWKSGRVALVGDAAFCVSLMAGQGSALAMAAAYALATELHRAGGDYRAAFDSYERLLMPFIAKKQRMAERFSGFFVPSSKFGLFLRNRLSALLSVPLLADLAIGREFADKIRLPEA